MGDFCERAERGWTEGWDGIGVDVVGNERKGLEKRVYSAGDSRNRRYGYRARGRGGGVQHPALYIGGRE